FLQTGKILKKIQEKQKKPKADEEEAQAAIQEGIAKAEKEEKIVTDEIAQPYKEKNI
ncbi:hypothetical protein J728_4169, partial [Acinetobacter baumannii 1276470-132]